MQVPSASSFAPLPELIAQFGIPDPFEILDLLQNELEQVDTATITWTGIADELEVLADELEQQSGSLFWTGAAETGFQEPNVSKYGVERCSQFVADRGHERGLGLILHLRRLEGASLHGHFLLQLRDGGFTVFRMFAQPFQLPKFSLCVGELGIHVLRICRYPFSQHALLAEQVLDVFFDPQVLM